jgi:predicted RNA-binding Zn ribbon-like protein
LRDIPRADHDFEFSGGSVALDFANTLGGMHTAPTHEHLIAYGDLIEFGRKTGTISPAVARRLIEQARRHPARAAAALRRATLLRETIWRVFDAFARDAHAEASDLAALHDADLRALAHVRFTQSGQGAVYEWTDESDLDRPTWAIARAAAELLRSTDLRLVRECGSDTCEWLFVDRTRNHTRRWCAMGDCGNREKVRRFRERRRRAAKAKSR